MIPPLRERGEDVVTLAKVIVHDLAKGMGTPVLSERALDVIRSYGWPGNVRELRNVLERALIVEQPQHIALSWFHPEVTAAKADTPSSFLEFQDFETMQKTYFRRVLTQVHGRVSGKGGAAEMTGLNPTTLRSRLERLGIKARDFQR